MRRLLSLWVKTANHIFRVSAAALAALLPNVTVLTLQGQDHGAFWEAPAPVAEQIREFLLESAKAAKVS